MAEAFPSRIPTSESALPGFILRPQPIATDDDQNDLALSHLAVQMRNEVGPSRNVVDIHKQSVAAESLREPVVQATGHAD